VSEHIAAPTIPRCFQPPPRIEWCCASAVSAFFAPFISSKCPPWLKPQPWLADHYNHMPLSDRNRSTRRFLTNYWEGCQEQWGSRVCDHV